MDRKLVVVLITFLLIIARISVVVDIIKGMGVLHGFSIAGAITGETSFTVNLTVAGLTIANLTPTNGTIIPQNTSLEIGMNITTSGTVVNATVNITFSNESRFFNLGDSDADGFFNITFNETFFPGSYNATLFANDTNGNSSTTLIAFTVIDITAPTIVILSPPADL